MARSAVALAAPQAVSALPPWPHQIVTNQFLSEQPRAFDNSSPGVGKTRSQIEAYDRRAQPKKRLLVLCPKTLMVSAWGEDIEKFAPRLTVSFAFASQRKEAFDTKTDVVIMNHDGVKWLFDKANQKRLLEFDHLVIDEYTAFKHSTSQRSKAMAGIRKYFKHRYGMSGTPTPNSVMELWHPALIIDDGARLGTSYFKLRAAVQTPTQVGPNPQHVSWEDKPGATQAINELLADITIRHKFEDVMTHVPPNHKHVVKFDLSAKARKIYATMEADCVAAFDDRAITAVHAAALRTKLLQIASGAVYDNPTNEESTYALIDDTRYDLIADLIEEREHTVAFFNWKHQRTELQRVLNARKLSFALIDGSVTKKGARAQIVSDYQAGKYRALLLHPKTGAHGLTLTRGTTTIFCSPIYEADLVEQGLARIYRGSQNKVTDTIFIEANNTVEQAVYARLNNKTANMTDLLEQMRMRSKKR